MLPVLFTLARAAVIVLVVFCSFLFCPELVWAGKASSSGHQQLPSSSLVSVAGGPCTELSLRHQWDFDVGLLQSTNDFDLLVEVVECRPDLVFTGVVVQTVIARAWLPRSFMTASAGVASVRLYADVVLNPVFHVMYTPRGQRLPSLAVNDLHWPLTRYTAIDLSSPVRLHPSTGAIQILRAQAEAADAGRRAGPRTTRLRVLRRRGEHQVHRSLGLRPAARGQPQIQVR